MLRVFVNGFSTGLILQLAIGPVFFFILNIALQRTLADGFCSVLAVTLVDYFYILLAIVGVGKLLEKKTIQKKMALISSAVLVMFGVIMLLSAGSALTESAVHVQQSSNYWSSFLTALLLTISSPLTIVFWTGMFATKAIEHEYGQQQLLIFGIAAGLATFLFLGASVFLLSLFQASIPVLLVKILNGLVGVLLILYGAVRLVKVLQGKA